MKTINSLRSKLFALTLALMASVSIQAHDFSVDGIYYNFLDDNNVEVTFKGDINYDEEYFNDIVIPQSVTYDDVTYMVTAIGREAFAECSQLTSVTFGDHVKSIGSSAFRQCTTLTCVTMPIGLERIGSSAFDNCTSLASITIPNSVMTIELGAFSNTAYCNDAKNWEEGVLYISNCLIEAKTSIAGDYSIKPGTRLIADYALFGCNNLTSVTFAQSVKSVGDASFYECKNMKVVNMSDSLQNIGDRAFAYCELLNPVTIPVGVKTFGTEVFMGCKSLVSIIWNAKDCQDFSNSFVAPFYRISSKITSITFGDEVEYIPAGMCYGLSALPSVTIPVNVKRIGKDAFESCASMTSITWNAKHYCDTLDYPPFEGLEYVVKSFTFGEGIETIPPYICKEMREVSEIIIPKGVKSIGRHAFNYCLSIPSVIIPEGVTTIGSAAFFHTQIRSVIVPDGVTEIGGWAFSECYGLNKIELPSTLDSIGNSAFKETYYIDTLICRAVLPPTMGELPVFEGVKTANISLFVPKESIELYKAADQWKDFGQILPIEPTSYKSQWCDTWNVAMMSTVGPDRQVNTYRYQLVQDTVVDGQTYTVLNCKATAEPNTLNIDLGIVRFADDRKVYANYNGKEYLVYDFSVQIGDTLDVLINAWGDDTQKCLVHNVSIDEESNRTIITLHVYDEYRKEFINDDYSTIKWIEGIGSENGFFEGVEKFVDGGGAKHLICAYQGDELKYTGDLYEEYGCGDDAEQSPEDLFPTLWGLQRTHTIEMYDYAPNDGKRSGGYPLPFASVKDTVINGKTYLQFGDYVNGSNYSLFFLREENNKVLIYSSILQNDLVLYDYTLELGDSLPAITSEHDYFSDVHFTKLDKAEDIFTYVVTDVSTVTLLDGIERKKWILKNKYLPIIEYVEGIGCYGENTSHSGDFFRLIHDHPYTTEYVGDHLVCVSKNGQLLYSMTQEEMNSFTLTCECLSQEDTIAPENLFPMLWGLQRTSCTKTIGEDEYGTVWGSRSYLMQEIETATIDGKQYLLFGIDNNYDKLYLKLWLREENNKILLYSTAQKKDLVLYDFTLNVGDSLPRLYVDYDLSSVVDYDNDEWGLSPLVVTEVSTITLLDGKEYKKWTFDNGMQYVEGIGSFATCYAHNDFYQLIANAPLSSDVYSQHLVCASKNGKLLYQMDDAEMERLGTECLCEYNSDPKKDNAKNGKIGGRPTPTQWNMLEVETKEMDGTPTILRAETFSYTLENDSIVTKGKTFYQLARQSTKDTAITKSFVGALHFGEDEDNRVYFLRDGIEYVLYDFTAEPGDTIEIFAGINNYPQYTTYTHVVTGKDTLENGACRMMLEVVFPDETSSVENAQKVWLAGLGSIDGIVHNVATRATKARSSETQTSVMLCAWREDDCLYTTDHPDYDSYGCVYNLPTSIKDIETPGGKCQKLIRDGHLYIIHNGTMYNVIGLEVK